jgi:hypothetical protein
MSGFCYELLQVEEIDNFIHIVMLRLLDSFDVFNYHMLVELDVVVDQSLMNEGEEGFHNLRYFLHIVAFGCLFKLNNLPGYLTLLTW